MGVIKNMMVRIGADASSLRKEMRSAASANKLFTASGKETKATAKGYESPFKAAGRAAAAYRAQIEAVGKANTMVKERFGRVTKELKKAQSVMQAVKTAASGLDMKKTFASQRADMLTQLDNVNGQLGSLDAGIKGSKNNIVQLNDGSILHLDEAKVRYASLTAESDKLAQKLTEIDAIEKNLGSSFVSSSIKDALKNTAAEVDKLGAEAKATEADMKRLAQQTAAKGTRGSPFGAGLSAFFKTAGGNMNQLFSGAKGGSCSVTDLLKGIKRIGVVSLGLRIASGLFGKLKSTISSCMQENLAFNETMNTLRYQVGQALVPTINLMTAGLQKAQPVIVGIASAINRVVTSLFGNMVDEANSAADAVASAGTYGFDQIVKIDKAAVSSENLTGSGMFTGVADKISIEIAKIKSAITNGDWKGIGSLFSGYLNTAFTGIDNLNLGEKITGAINSAIEFANSLIKNTEWSKIGGTIGTNLESGVTSFDWTGFGTLLGNSVVGILDLALELVRAADWGKIGDSLINGIIDSIVAMDWTRIYAKASTLAEDWRRAIIQAILAPFGLEMPEEFLDLTAVGKPSPSAQVDGFQELIDRWKPDLGAIPFPSIDPTSSRTGIAGTTATVPYVSGSNWGKTMGSYVGSEGFQSGQPTVLKVYVGGKKVHEETIDYINSRTRETGVCPIHT